MTAGNPRGTLRATSPVGYGRDSGSNLAVGFGVAPASPPAGQLFTPSAHRLPRFACQTTFAAQTVRRTPCGRLLNPLVIRSIRTPQRRPSTPDFYGNPEPKTVTRIAHRLPNGYITRPANRAEPRPSSYIDGAFRPLPPRLLLHQGHRGRSSNCQPGRPFQKRFATRQAQFGHSVGTITCAFARPTNAHFRLPNLDFGWRLR